eukprot:3905172-Heterocapsa_arctica.AAC.1
MADAAGGSTGVAAAQLPPVSQLWMGQATRASSESGSNMLPVASKSSFSAFARSAAVGIRKPRALPLAWIQLAVSSASASSAS